MTKFYCFKDVDNTGGMLIAGNVYEMEYKPDEDYIYHYDFLIDMNNMMYSGIVFRTSDSITQKTSEYVLLDDHFITYREYTISKLLTE